MHDAPMHDAPLADSNGQRSEPDTTADTTVPPFDPADRLLLSRIDEVLGLAEERLLAEREAVRRRAEDEARAREQARARREQLLAALRGRQASALELRRQFESLELDSPDDLRAVEEELSRSIAEVQAEVAREEPTPESQGRAEQRGLDELRALLHGVEVGAQGFQYLEKTEQYHQLCIWAGKGRALQAATHSPTPEQEQLFARLFRVLTHTSATYQPGYTDALRRDASYDWLVFVRDHEVALARARNERDIRVRAENTRREAESEAREQQVRRRLEGRRLLRQLEDDLATGSAEVRSAEGGSAGMGVAGLGGVETATTAPAEGGPAPIDPDWFRAQVEALLERLDASDRRLVELVRPYAAILEGNAFRRLRRVLRIEEGEVPTDAESEEERLLLRLEPHLRAKRLWIVGGYERNALRDVFESGLSLDRLRWVETEGNRSTDWGAVEAAIRAHGVDLLVVLTDFVGHDAEKLRPVCEREGVPFVRVGSGCGLLRILQSIERMAGFGGPEPGALRQSA